VSVSFSDSVVGRSPPQAPAAIAANKQRIIAHILCTLTIILAGALMTTAKVMVRMATIRPAAHLPLKEHFPPKSLSFKKEEENMSVSDYIEQLNYGFALISPIEPIEELTKEPVGFREKKFFVGERPAWKIEAIASHDMTSQGVLIPIPYKVDDIVALTTPQEEIAHTFKENSFVLNGTRVLAIACNGILLRFKKSEPQS